MIIFSILSIFTIKNTKCYRLVQKGAELLNTVHPTLSSCFSLNYVKTLNNAACSKETLSLHWSTIIRGGVYSYATCQTSPVIKDTATPLTPLLKPTHNKSTAHTHNTHKCVHF